MAMICRNGSRECTGCMRCYDEREEFEDELYPFGYKYEDEEDLYND